MKKQQSARERLKISSIAFMKALRPKINSTGKKKNKEANRRSSTIMTKRLDNNLNYYPGTI